MRLELEALLALDAGNRGQAVALLARASELEETLPFEFPLPASLMPPHELLGEVSLELAGIRSGLEQNQRHVNDVVGKVPRLGFPAMW